ncbi:MAG: cell division protein FtsI [Peptococcaceae bacterium]|nr:MAG: cell division protein FtsI [Peptococcaceae bacterium]
MKQSILKIWYLLLGCFLALVFYLSYLQIGWGPALAAHQRNPRLAEYEAKIKRGAIYDLKGVVLAETRFAGDKRIYPRGADFAPVVGFVSDRYGRTGLESAYDRYLLGKDDLGRFKHFFDRLLDQEEVGNDLTLTIDADLQKAAFAMLDGYRGAIVVLDSRSGAVRALASAPSFDPNRLDDNWPRLLEDEAKPLLNRAVQGAYPPGSTFKLVTAAGALVNLPGVAERTFNCPGYLVVEGYKLNDTAVHGAVYFTEALAVSCNTTFAALGLELGAANFYQTARSFGLGREPPLELAVRTSTLAGPDRLTGTELASSAIGQGEVLVTPFQMALVTAAIANNGIIMRPYLVSKVESASGELLQQAAPQPWLTATTPPAAGVIREGMRAAVQYGTARAAAVPGITVAGKTGSAQNPHGKTHAWFVGFAPAQEPQLVVAVVLENAGAGGTVAAPLAGRLLKRALGVR